MCSGLSGCTTAQEAEVVTGLQNALSDLQQNRALTEQYVRDIKATVSPSDPDYEEVMDSYQDARESYDHYLDSVESDPKTPPSRSLRRSGPVDVQNATADFLADATSLLKPEIKTRRIPFQRAIVIPDNLQATLQKVPKKARNKIIDTFDDQVRWRAWSQL
jgi:hypothetical protein